MGKVPALQVQVVPEIAVRGVAIGLRLDQVDAVVRMGVPEAAAQGVDFGEALDGRQGVCVREPQAIART